MWPLSSIVRWPVSTKLLAVFLYSLAGLVVASGATLWLSTRSLVSPGVISEDRALALVLAVYAASLAALVVSVLARRTTLAVWRDQPRSLIASSAMVVLGFIGWATWVLVALLRSTDL